MAFRGYLIKLGGSSGVELPLKYVKAESYNATPDQRMEHEAKRSVTGYLTRTTCDHTATKVELNTIPLTNREVVVLNNMITSRMSDVKQRKITLEYYDNETDSYKTGVFYMPDVQYPIMRIEGNTIYYNSLRLAFIEY